MCDRGAALFSYGPKTETVVKTIQQLCLIARSMVSLVHDSHKSSKGHEWDFPAGLCSSPVNPLTIDFSNLP